MFKPCKSMKCESASKKITSFPSNFLYYVINFLFLYRNWAASAVTAPPCAITAPTPPQPATLAQWRILCVYTALTALSPPRPALRPLRPGNGFITLFPRLEPRILTHQETIIF